MHDWVPEKFRRCLRSEKKSYANQIQMLICKSTFLPLPFKGECIIRLLLYELSVWIFYILATQKTQIVPKLARKFCIFQQNCMILSFNAKCFVVSFVMQIVLKLDLYDKIIYGKSTTPLTRYFLLYFSMIYCVQRHVEQTRL